MAPDTGFIFNFNHAEIQMYFWKQTSITTVTKDVGIIWSYYTIPWHNKAYELDLSSKDKNSKTEQTLFKKWICFH